MRVAVKLAYDGTRFSGSQVQPGVRTVHGELASALEKLTGQPAPPLRWAGRTDAGVSAVGNVVAFETDLPRDRLLASLTFAMEDACAWALAEVDAGFEPRHAARRTYRYHLVSDLDAAALEGALRLFEGTHDFTAFCRLEPGVNPVRTVERARVAREGPRLVADVTGQSFLWNQVRRMVEAARRVAAGDARAEDVRRALAAGEPADFGTAPPEPLVLLDVAYEGVRFEPAPPDVRARLFERVRRRRDAALREAAVLHELARAGEAP